MTNLGPFLLRAPLGSGGMGAVWEGVHEASGAPVAVKLLRESQGADPRIRALFLREVHATAALDHPRIVRILDAGVVPPGAEGGLVPGTPWLAMELVRGTPLTRWRGRLPWARLRPLLLDLLDALAHAHARGVIHRDLKPANVIVDPDGAAHLLDFGIAARVTPEGLELVASGTPAYMAPEQAEADGRDTGPWTDLFAFGSLAWAMVGGKPPFSNARGGAALAERSRPLPALVPVARVPPGLEAWLRTLLRFDPASRYQRATDAARDLRALPDSDGDKPKGSRAAEDSDRGADAELSASEASFGAGRTPEVDPSDAGSEGGKPRGSRTLPRVGGPEDATLLLPTPQPPTASHSNAATVLLAGSAPVVRGRVATDRPAAPAGSALPERPPVRSSRPRLLGTGLGLWGVREPPFVGRAEARATLWTALREVEDGGVAAILLQGPPGLGKSRLARWSCEEAHHGGAHVSTAYHGPTPGPGHGIAAMVARDLGAQGLAGAALKARLGRVAPAPAVAGLVALLESSGRERHAAVVDHLARRSAERPVVVWLDDLPHGPDSLGALLHLLGSRDRSDLRVLVVATADTAPGGPVPVPELDGAGVRRLAVGPLSSLEVAELVTGLVGAGGRLAEDVAARAGGSPSFAIQLVSAWIDRGLLVAAPHGFELARGATPPVPTDLVEAWADRVEQGLAGLPARDGEALERAAVLGGRVEVEAWRTACELGGFLPSQGLLSRAAARGLLVATPEGWTFAHGQLVVALERRARLAGRLRAHHLAAAAVVGDTDPGRAGYHLLEGDHAAEAFPRLLQGARSRRMEAADHRGALADTALAERALDRLEADDARRGEVWVEQAMCLRATGRYAEARALSDRTVARLGEPGWARLAGPARLTAAQIARDGGDLAAAEVHASASLAAAESAGDPDRAATARIELGYVAWWSRDLPLAEERFRGALASLDSELGRADVNYALALVALSRQDAATALRHLDLAEPTWASYGHRLGLARVHNARGSAFAQERDAPERRSRAIAHWRQALELYASVGSSDAVIPRLNLASTLVEDGRDEEALAVLEPGRWRSDDGRPFFAGALELLRAAALARRGSRADLREALQRASELLDRAPRRDPETADIALRLVPTVAHAEERGLAAALALTLCERSRDPERVERARALVRG